LKGICPLPLPPPLVKPMFLTR